MTDGIPSIKINLEGNTDHEVTPENSALYTYVAELASRDHVYVNLPDEAGNLTRGLYLFLLAFDPDQNVVEFMRNNGYQCYLDIRHILPDDEEAFQRMTEKAAASFTLPDTLPEDFS